MKSNRRWRRGAAALVSLAVACASPAARAQGWKPDRSVELVVGAGPGGGNDNTARTVQKLLQEYKLVGVPISVVNKPGAGGAISVAYLQQSAANGIHIAVSSNTLLTNHITKKAAPDPADITPLAILINEYIAFNVKGDSQIRDAKDLLSRLKADPGSVVAGISTALGNINHIALATVAREAGVDPRKIKTVVFGSSGASITALMGGHVDLVVGPVSIAAQRARTGEIRALALTAPRRRPGALADVPTWKELGLNAVVDNWRGLIGPKGMPAEQVAFWDQALGRMFQLEEWKKDVERNDWDNAAMASRESARYLAETYQELKRALAALDLVNK